MRTCGVSDHRRRSTIAQRAREDLICIHTGPYSFSSSFSSSVSPTRPFLRSCFWTRRKWENDEDERKERACVKTRRNRGLLQVAAPRRWGGAMLNMAPDKAADETISFRCYPLSAALLYTGRPALSAFLLSFFLPPLVYLLVPLVLSFYLLACIGPFFYFFSLSPDPSPSFTKIYLPPTSLFLFPLSSFCSRFFSISHARPMWDTP